MQTILGSNGPIGTELANELYKNYTHDLRLVSLNPEKVNKTDELMSADLLDFNATKAAVADSGIVYFTVGLPMNSDLWKKNFPIIMRNVIDACELNNSKLVFFDNTYMYPKTSEIQYENAPFIAKGAKASVRAEMAQMVIDAFNTKKIEAVICRAPEFYGPGKAKSITNTTIFNNIKYHKKPRVPVSDKTLRNLVWTPDASRAMALIGNTPSAYNQTWHLPCDDSLTYQQLISLTELVTHSKIKYSVTKMWQFKLLSYFNHDAKELQELLPRYQVDNNFNFDKFKQRFPNFKVTIYKDGITEIFKEKK